MGNQVGNVEQIARVAHETNRAYCASIGDLSQPSWEDAPEWQRSSAIKGVEFHLAAHARGETPAPSRQQVTIHGLTRSARPGGRMVR